MSFFFFFSFLNPHQGCCFQPPVFTTAVRALLHCISRCWCHSPLNCSVSWPPSPFNGGRQSYCRVRSRPQVTSSHTLLGSLTISQSEARGSCGKGQRPRGAAVKAESGHLNLYAAFNVFADPQLSASIKHHAVSLSSQESVMLFFFSPLWNSFKNCHSVTLPTPCCVCTRRLENFVTVYTDLFETVDFQTRFYDKLRSHSISPIKRLKTM